MGFFEIGSLKLFAQGWIWTVILLLSASPVTRITGMSHWHLAICSFCGRQFCISLLCNCDQNPHENNLKEKEFIWLMVSEGSVHGLPVPWAWASIMVALSFFPSLWTGSRVQRNRNWLGQGTVPIYTPLVTYFLQPGPTFHSSTMSR
jgi:hypothetical protein